MTAHESVEPTVEQLLLRLDEEADAALSTPDLTALTSLFASDYLHTHSNGLRQNRSEYFDRISAKVEVPTRERSNVVVEMHGDIAVTAGDSDIHYVGGRDLYKRYVRVWRRSDAGWELIAHHNLAAVDREPDYVAQRR
jgi:hypothetical protein